MEPTIIKLAPEVWVALVTFVAGPLVASIAANLSLRGAVVALKEEMQDMRGRIIRLEDYVSPRRVRRSKK